MYGVITRDADAVDREAFDLAFYETKDVTGRADQPLPGCINACSTFADDAAARSDPDVVPVTADGTRATRERPQFDWAHVCPTHPDYREGLLEIVADCADAAPDVRIDDVGFPREEYCHCERCDRLFAESDRDDREAWRADVISEFVADARERVPGDLYLTVHPDPYPGHLRSRSGIDLDRLARYVDEFVVPLYDTHYGTTYWVEVIASGFETALDAPFAVELYAVDVDVDALVRATEVAEAYADDVLFGYDTSTATAVVRRRRADANEGASYRPEADGPDPTGSSSESDADS